MTRTLGNDSNWLLVVYKTYGHKPAAFLLLILLHDVGGQTVLAASNMKRCRKSWRRI
jgi:hypothetical protein